MSEENLNEIASPEFELCEACYAKLQEIMKSIKGAKEEMNEAQND